MVIDIIIFTIFFISIGILFIWFGIQFIEMDNPGFIYNSCYKIKKENFKIATIVCLLIYIIELALIFFIFSVS